MSTSFANLGGVADPRMNSQSDDIGKGHGSVAADIAPRERRASYANDTTITFEDYHYWANQSREYEKHLDTKNAGLAGIANLIIGKGHKNKESEKNSNNTEMHGVDPKAGGSNTDYGISEAEWEHSNRAMRTATWGSIFYLITTDILGPYNVPWAISQMGFGPGIALYTVFGGFAFYSGLQLWQMVICNVLQSFQFFLNVVLIIESNGQGLAQMAQGPSGNGFLCFVVAEVVFMICGFLLGQIRTLQRLSFLANLAIWLNVIVIIMTMVVTAKFPPNYDASFNSYQTPKYQPIVTAGYWPPGTGVADHVNGLMNCVFAFGGATLFNELMVEMRRPMDFWKGFICAEIFIYVVYIVMGTVVYSNQGQYVYNPAYQGIPSSAYSWQTLGNAVSLISALIAALLYGNIGIKVFYAAVLRDVFRFPPLDKKAGKWIWVACVPIYWGLAMIVAGALPQIANLTAFVGAACILQFSYTFPPILKVGFNVQKDAMLPEEVYDPATGQVQRRDHGWARWARGYRKKLFINTFDMIYFVGALATAGLGIWASCIAMHATFTAPDSVITPFTCKNPAG